jgi:hypothetical protein
MNKPQPQRNVNVTLASDHSTVPRTFPCPICGTSLDVRDSRTGKPYCVCTSSDCGLQIFFRGKNAIARLRDLLDREQSFNGPTTPAVAAFTRLEQLRAQKNALEHKRGLIFTDDDLERTISAVEKDIERVQRMIGEFATGTKS